MTAAVAISFSSTSWAQIVGAEPPPPFRNQEPYLEVHSTLTHTDNVFLTPGNKGADTLAAIGVGLDLRETLQRLSLNARGDLDYVDYLEHSYDPKTFGYFDGIGILGKNTDWVQWNVEETFGQLLIDPFAVPTPNNLKNVNYLTTGPTVNIPLGSRTRVSFYGMYSTVRSDIDSHQLQEGAAIEYAASNSVTVSAHATAQTTHSENLFPELEFTTQEQFVRAAVNGIRTIFTLDLGRAQLKDAGSTSSTPLIRAEIARRISGVSTISLTAAQEYITSVDLLRASAGFGAPVGAQAPISTLDPLKDKAVALAWNVALRRTNIYLRYSWRDEIYTQATVFNNSVTSVEVGIDRKLSSVLTATIVARNESWHYQNSVVNNHDTIINATLQWRLGRKLSLIGGFQRDVRSANEHATDYSENRIALRVTYALIGLQ